MPTFKPYGLVDKILSALLEVLLFILDKLLDCINEKQRRKGSEDASRSAIEGRRH